MVRAASPQTQRPPAQYETLMIAQADLEKDAIDGLVNKSGLTLKKHGARLLKTTEWGRRRLAYEIDKQTDGFYLLLEFEGAGETVKRFQEFLGLQSEVLRFMTTRKGERSPAGSAQSE